MVRCKNRLFEDKNFTEEVAEVLIEFMESQAVNGNGHTLTTLANITGMIADPCNKHIAMRKQQEAFRQSSKFRDKILERFVEIQDEKELAEEDAAVAEADMRRNFEDDAAEVGEVRAVSPSPHVASHGAYPREHSRRTPGPCSNSRPLCGTALGEGETAQTCVHPRL